MALNRHFAEANQVSLTVPDGTLSGDAVRIGTLNGVALIDQQDDDTATVQLDGAFRFELDGPIDVGQAVSVDDVGGTADGNDGNAGGDTFGHALAALENGDTAEIPIRIANPVA